MEALGPWLFAGVIVGSVVGFWLWESRRDGASLSWFRGTPGLSGFDEVDRLKLETLGTLPNPFDNSIALGADHYESFTRRARVRYRYKHRQVGVLDSLPAFSFDFGWSYRTGGSERRTRLVIFSVVVVDLGVAQHSISIKPEKLSHRLGKIAGRTDIDFDDPAFDRAFFVQSKRESAAQDFLTPLVRNALVACDLSSADFYVRDRYLMVAVRRAGRQSTMIEALRPVLSAIRTSHPG